MADFDFLVIGGGSGGVRAARRAAEYGAKTALVERQHLGGTCVNVGCVPKKLMVYAAEMRETLELAPGYGWNMNAAFSWPDSVAHRDQEISRLRGSYRQLLADAGVTLIEGTATLTGPHGTRVDNHDYRARHILIATGGTPIRPQLPGAALAIVSDQAFHLPKLPRRMCVVGGGYIGIEFACIFTGLGVEVTLLHRGAQLLRGFDREAVEFLRGVLPFSLRLDTQVTHIRHNAGALAVDTHQGESLQTDTILYAIGRSPSVDGLGLKQAGVAVSPRGGILVNSRYRSSIPSIHAIGDVTQRIQLTPAAIAEAEALTRGLFRNEWAEPGYGLIPSAVFSHPCLATIGLTQDQAEQKHGKIQVLRTQTKALRYAFAKQAPRSFIKVIAKDDDKRILGIHIVAPEAAELIQGFTLAMQAGATTRQLKETIGIHPTLAEECFSVR